MSQTLLKESVINELRKPKEAGLIESFADKDFIKEFNALFRTNLQEASAALKLRGIKTKNVKGKQTETEIGTIGDTMTLSGVKQAVAYLNTAYDIIKLKIEDGAPVKTLPAEKKIPMDVKAIIRERYNETLGRVFAMKARNGSEEYNHYNKQDVNIAEAIKPLSEIEFTNIMALKATKPDTVHANALSSVLIHKVSEVINGKLEGQDFIIMCSGIAGVLASGGYVIPDAKDQGRSAPTPVGVAHLVLKEYPAPQDPKGHIRNTAKQLERYNIIAERIRETEKDLQLA